MATKFDIEIHALDKFTAVFRRLNKGADEAARPLVNMKRQAGNLFSEMKVPQALKGFRSVSRAAQEMTGSLGSAGGPAAALFGLGTAGGVVATVAAVGQLASTWATLGTNVLQVSRMIGINAQELQRWQGAAKLAGVSAEDMTSSLGNFARTQQDARYGRNVLAAQVMRGFGINGTDPSRGMHDIARVMASMPSAQTRVTLAESLGVSPSLIPLLMRGRGGVATFMQSAEGKGMVLSADDLQKAEKARIQALGVGGTATGIANTIGGIVAPAAGDLLEEAGNALSRDKGPALPGMSRDNRPAFIRDLSGATQKQRDDMRAAYGRDHGANSTRLPVEITVKIPNAPEGTEVEAEVEGRSMPIRRSMED